MDVVNLGAGASATHSDVNYSGDYGFGLALCGSIFCMLGFTYFLNAQDVLVRRNSWHFLGISIPIFVGVLATSFTAAAFSTAADAWPEVVDPISSLSGIPTTVVVRLLHALAWQAAFRFGARILSGIAREEHKDDRCFRRRKREIGLIDAKAEKQRKMRHRMLDSRVLGYGSGFAAVMAGSAVQDELDHMFESRCLINLAFVLVAIGFCAIVALISEYGSRLVVMLCKGQCLKDEAEALRRQMVYDGEHDGIALMGSVLLMRALSLPMRERDTAFEKHFATRSQAGGQCLLALVVFAGFTIYHHLFPKYFVCGKGHCLKLLHRFSEVMTLLLAMTSCWSMYWATKAVVEVFAEEFAAPHSALRLLETFRSAVIAVVVSIFAAVYLWVCIKITQCSCLDERRKKEIEDRLIFAAMAVAFTWEKVFHSAIHSAAHESQSPILTEFALTLLCIFVIVPGWKTYIVPMDDEGGFNFGIVARQVVQKAEGMMSLREPDSREYRVAYRSMLIEMLRALPDESAVDSSEFSTIPFYEKTSLANRLLGP
eukprot:TRINITY_DN9706_c2_g1_i1.p1 TRINITY_DN9706_c2_g1~~TRINITY_DN9706_c2_g1_i1.p1  ORF type:complete len:567 (-),score=72.89 TRINITY_DN9706_c2_g1_i1:48-1670(-)